MVFVVVSVFGAEREVVLVRLHEERVGELRGVGQGAGRGGGTAPAQQPAGYGGGHRHQSQQGREGQGYHKPHQRHADVLVARTRRRWNINKYTLKTSALK